MNASDRRALNVTDKQRLRAHITQITEALDRWIWKTEDEKSKALAWDDYTDRLTDLFNTVKTITREADDD